MADEIKTVETEAETRAKANVARIEAGYAKLGASLKADETTFLATVKRNKWAIIVAVVIVVEIIYVIKK